MNLDFKIYFYCEIKFFKFYVSTKHPLWRKQNQASSLKKELWEIGEEAIWESRFTFFLFCANFKLHRSTKFTSRMKKSIGEYWIQYLPIFFFSYGFTKVNEKSSGQTSFDKSHIQSKNQLCCRFYELMYIKIK